MPSLFISYRRGDSPDTVKLIHERLTQRLPRWAIFYDHESIPLGERFPEQLRAKVMAATAVLVIVGPKWVEILHERKSAPMDHVREEVRLALETGASVVPVLAGRAVMPTDADLADFADLQPLLKRNGRPVRPDPDFDSDLEPLIAHLKSLDAAEAVGTILDDKYTLTAEIGDGGMGVVYAAQQKKPVQRMVAVKFIKPGMDSRDVLARFDAERQALAVMDHPNVAKVLDAGMTPHGRPYFVMEYVKGVPITQYCDDKKLTPQERLNLFIPVCNAVQHAHQKGIIHRDLKPSNVLVEVVDGKPVPKVIDFGLAKALGQKLTDKTLHTALETRVGTLEYSSPEQAAGQAFEVDTRTDIYSLGALIYELLTGEPPFTREELMKVGEDRMRQMIRETEPSKPSKKLSSSGELPAIALKRSVEPAKLPRLVKGDLDWIVMKCLEREKALRYETAKQLGEDLQRFLTHQPVHAGPPSYVYRARKFLRRNKGPVFASLLVLLALFGGMAITFFGFIGTDRGYGPRVVRPTDVKGSQDNPQPPKGTEDRQVNATMLAEMQTPNTDQSSDAGFWLFNNPPRKHLKEKYKFDSPAIWYDHLRTSCVRFTSGGSGSFVSADGLVMTNRHVALSALQKLKNPTMDYVKDGFYAANLHEEFKAVDEELDVLMEIVDVTDHLNTAVTPAMTADQAFEVRRATISKLETDSEKQTGFRSTVVSLFRGGQYHLYRYKVYSDIRLVFAPEEQIAFFGGDIENFAYPRHNLDACFFRVYENGKPAKIEHYLKWSNDGAQENDLVFLSGNPNQTNRDFTVADLEYMRDFKYPYALQRFNRLEAMLTAYSGISNEHERQAQDLLFSVYNSRKFYRRGLAGLKNGAVMARKAAQEKALRIAVAKRPDLKDLTNSWDTIADFQRIRAANAHRFNVLEAAHGFNSTLFGFARTLVRASEELKKPSSQRLAEFEAEKILSLKSRLFSNRVLYKEFELAKLSESLSWMNEVLGEEDLVGQRALAKRSPRDRAADILDGTKLWDVEERRRLYEGGKTTIDESTDPMILLAKLVDTEARKVRKNIDDHYGPNEQAHDKIAQAKLAVGGNDAYPDGTSTLRLSFGICKGYVEMGEKIPFATKYEDLYNIAQNQKNRPPFDLPPRWLERKGKLNLKTLFNFVSTADIVGGHSGSPVVNRSCEVVGLIFDGNLQSLEWDFVYTDQQARAVSVSSQAITGALRAIFDANPLADEIARGRMK